MNDNSLLERLTATEAHLKAVAAQIVSPQSLHDEYQARANTLTEARHVVHCWELIEELREEPGASVTIVCDNEEPPPANAIEVCDEWTNWEERRFDGDNILECLLKAKEAKDNAAVTS